MGEYYIVSHSGIRGQRWYERRYQYKDGSLTPLGRIRYRNAKRKEAKQEKLKQRRAREEESHERTKKYNSEKAKQIGQTREVIGSSTKVTAAAKSALDKSIKRDEARSKKKMDLSNMSDDDLKNAINRMSLERKYKELKGTDVSTGKKHVSELLDKTNDVINVGTSALGFLEKLYEVKSRK